MNIVAERRFGTFRVSGTMIHQHPDEILQALRSVLVVEARHLYASDHVEYTGFSEYFAPVEPGQIAKSYDLVGFRQSSDSPVEFEFKPQA